MSKIICDICGTTYQSSAESCPICGFRNEAYEDQRSADVDYEYEEATAVKTGKFTSASKKREIFDYDEVNSDEYDEDEEYEDNDDEEEDYDEEEEEEAPRSNVFVVILLTVLIVVLLGAAGFIFLRFFLPNMKADESVETTAATELITEPSTEATIPCEYMTMTNAGVAELNEEGQQFLLHVRAIPENTTDQIIYTSADESIATVSDDGKITAVSEGETVVYISCGIYSIECPVIVQYIEETVPPTTEAIVEETVAETTAEEEAAVSENAQEENTGLKNVTLKLKKTDIRLGVYYEFQLQLDCDLDPEEVTWSSEHEYIAKVDNKGNVTAVKEGTTSITAKYGDQEVQCIVRCVW